MESGSRERRLQRSLNSAIRELWIRAHSGLGKVPGLLTLLELSSSLQCITNPTISPCGVKRWFFWRPREDYLSPEGVSRLRCCLLTQGSLSIICVCHVAVEMLD